MGFIDRMFGAVDPAAVETRQLVQDPNVPLQSITPAQAAWLGLQMFPVGDVSSERALGLTAYWRGVNIIAGTIAGLPLKTYLKNSNGDRKQIKSFLDNPAGPYARGGLTPFAWKELVVMHIVVQGNTYLEHVRNNAGSMIGLLPTPPSTVAPKWTGDADKVFQIASNPKRTLDSSEMTQIMGMSENGLQGLSPVTLFRNALKTSVAGEDAAQRGFRGALLSGLVTTGTDVEGTEAKEIQEKLDEKFDNITSRIAVVNRDLKFTPWSMTAEDAQFLQSRAFQVEEISRMLGVPPHLLGQTEKQTSWGTGVAEQNLGLARYTLSGYTSRIEESLSALLPPNQFVEFDYKGLLQGTPTEEIALLITQVDAGLLTADEARKILNRPPLGNGAPPKGGQGATN